MVLIHSAEGAEWMGHEHADCFCAWAADWFVLRTKPRSYHPSETWAPSVITLGMRWLGVGGSLGVGPPGFYFYWAGIAGTVVVEA